MLFKTSLMMLISLAFMLPAPSALGGQQLVIEQAWIADAPAIASIRAGYLQLHNKGKQAVTIKGFSSADFSRIEFHKTVVADGMVKMEEIKSLTIQPGERIEFKPGGYHLMLFDPKHRLNKGDKIKLLVRLNDKTTAAFTAVVRERGDNMQHNHHHH